MKLGRKILLGAAFVAVAAFVFGGAAAIATGNTGDPIHPTNCVWSVEKTATIHGSHTQITSLDLSKGQTITVDYTVVVTRTCPEGFDPSQEGGSAGVFDSYAGELNTSEPHLFLDNHDAFASATFTYSRDITAETCDSFDVENTVNVVDGDPLHPFASDTLTIHVNVHCDHGCTLTQGYWKTHSNRGPAPLDDTWNLLPNSQDTIAFLPNVDAKGDPGTWYSVFWTPPSGGNVYYQLAHQYMAAKLNKLNGASSTSAVDAAITAADGFFAAYTPAEAGALASTSTARKNALAWATTLGNYNTGLIGPGHCDEDSHSSTSP